MISICTFDKDNFNLSLLDLNIVRIDIIVPEKSFSILNGFKIVI
jgi:hypothetical protein